MDNTQSEHHQSDSSPAEAVAQLSQSVAQSAKSHRALIQEMALFAKDEGVRFVNLRLERNGQALDKLQNCHGIPGLISVQQEWLRDFLQDYLGQNVRIAHALRGLSQDVMERATEQVADTLDRVHQVTGEGAHQANQQMNQQSQEAHNYEQPTHH